MRAKTLLFSGLACLLLANLAAAWTWEEFKGTTQWKVEATDDESGCGGGLKTKDVVSIMQHDGEMVDITSLGHGRVRGGFMGNKLTIPPMTIPDGSGQSKLSSVDLAFTPDCRGFSGRYTWDYRDSMMSCSGTTTVRGERLDAAGCPEPERRVVPIADVRALQDIAQKEQRYKEILKDDPGNFWANWDMAELKKKQGYYSEYLAYFDKAITDESIYAKTREELRKTESKRLGLSGLPTPDTSPLLQAQKKEVGAWDGGLIYDTSVPKETATKRSVKERLTTMLWSIFVPDAPTYNVVDQLVGVPPQGGER
jgi:hypothetical protein